MQSIHSCFLSEWLPLARKLSAVQTMLDFDEALSEAMLALWRASTQWRQEAPFEHFATKCIRQSFVTAWKKNRAEKRGGGFSHLSFNDPELALCETVPDEEHDAEDTIRFESKDRMRQGLAELGEHHRKVIVLRYGLDGEDERTAAEVGEVLGFSKKLVDTLEATALRELAGKMESG